MENEEAVRDIAMSFQKECHESVRVVLKHFPGADMNTAINAWMFRKLAELKLQIDSLTKS